MSDGNPAKSTYARNWDRYVDHWDDFNNADGRLSWPGDEWGTPESWEQVWTALFVPSGALDWERAVEIGPGSGKYTLMVAERTAASIVAYDVSERFLGICRGRCENLVTTRRLDTVLLAGVDPGEMLADVEARGWRRKLDAMYSIDAMVHVDLQYLIVYFITAGLTLRPGGSLVLSLSNTASDDGFAKLVDDISWTFPTQADPNGSGKFEWVTPDLVDGVLTRLGFAITTAHTNGRDQHLVAQLVDPDRADGYERFVGNRGT